MDPDPTEISAAMSKGMVPVGYGNMTISVVWSVIGDRVYVCIRVGGQTMLKGDGPRDVMRQILRLSGVNIGARMVEEMGIGE